MNGLMSLTTLVFTHAAWHGGMWGPWVGGWGGFGLGWLFGPIFSLVWLAVIAFVVWLVWRNRGAGWGRWSAVSATQRARDILAERYARGEISTEEYRDRLEQLG